MFYGAWVNTTTEHATEYNYVYRTLNEPHQARREQLLRDHPEARKLMGYNPMSAFWVLAINVLQIAIAAFLGARGVWWEILLAAFAVGAVANHALFTLIHEATHNLIFKKTISNRIIGIVCNFAQVIPSAMGFRTFHLIHHKHQGNLDLDADLPGPLEARIIGKSPVSKALWLFCFALVQGFIRPARLKSIPLWNAWVVTNLVVQMLFNAAVVYFFGWAALIYLGISTWFSVGLHPLGGRWVQEHFVFREGQETYSYYGPANRVMFDVGYHNEHHDLMTVPWNNLRKLKAMAPEMYEPLHSHQSYIKLLGQFFFNPNVNAFSRVVLKVEPATAQVQPLTQAKDSTTASAQV
ncbi:MAG: fatty acid desaturase [Proteobacteria bacterium]|nr:MAG: fatty acid desaturase [Pseudomonadota bacterium]